MKHSGGVTHALTNRARNLLSIGVNAPFLGNFVALLTGGAVFSCSSDATSKNELSLAFTNFAFLEFDVLEFVSLSPLASTSFLLPLGFTTSAKSRAQILTKL